MPFLFLLLLPFLEIYGIYRVGQIIGGWETFWLLLLIAFLGFHFIRLQGLSSWAKHQEQMKNGQAPANHLLEGLFTLVGGILFIIPGFITDIFAIILIFPLTRKLFLKTAGTYFKDKIKSGNIKFYTNASAFNDQTVYENRPMKDVSPTKDETLLKPKNLLE